MSVTAPPPSTAPAGGSSPSSPAPVRESCPLCGAPLDPEQGWCLHCGAAARTRLAASSNWKAPLIALALVALVSLGVLAAALVKLAGNSPSSGPAVTSTVYRAPTTAAPATPGATGPTTPTGPTSGPTGPTSGPTGPTPGPTGPTSGPTAPAKPSPSGAAGLSPSAAARLSALERTERLSHSPAVKQRVRAEVRRLLGGK